MKTQQSLVYGNLHTVPIFDCTDLLWKTITLYLLDVEKIAITIPSPKQIIRDAVRVEFLTTQEGEQCIDMINARNETSHI